MGLVEVSFKTVNPISCNVFELNYKYRIRGIAGSYNFLKEREIQFL